MCFHKRYSTTNAELAPHKSFFLLAAIFYFLCIHWIFHHIFMIFFPPHHPNRISRLPSHSGPEGQSLNCSNPHCGFPPQQERSWHHSKSIQHQTRAMKQISCHFASHSTAVAPGLPGGRPSRPPARRALRCAQVRCKGAHFSPKRPNQIQIKFWHIFSLNRKIRCHKCLRKMWIVYYHTTAMRTQPNFYAKKFGFWSQIFVDFLIFIFSLFSRKKIVLILPSYVRQWIVTNMWFVDDPILSVTFPTPPSLVTSSSACLYNPRLPGLSVLLHTDRCNKKLLPWFDGLLDINEQYFKATGAQTTPVVWEQRMPQRSNRKKSLLSKEPAGWFRVYVQAPAYFGSYFRVWHKKTLWLGVRVFKSRRSENPRVTALFGLAQSDVFLGEAFAPPMCAELKKQHPSSKW